MKVLVPATSANLGPGFDTLGLAISLKNSVLIKRSNYFSLSIKGEGAKSAKLKSNNAFVCIFYDIYKELTGRRDNFRFEFYNAIPLSRGLGSSSAVIAGAIGAAYEMAGLKVKKQKILNKALLYESHPDNITPAVQGGFTVSIVENNKVLFQKKEIPSYLKAVMVIPDRSMSTRHSRLALPRSYSAQSVIHNVSHSSFLTASIFNEDWHSLKVASTDRLHQNRRMSNLPELFEVQKTALENGALMSTLSGSGSSFFNMTYEDDAIFLERKLKNRFPDFKVAIYDFNNKGLEIE